ncbi:hypothetical protein B7463_g11171, partial [Scytalidium lignicola]
MQKHISTACTFCRRRKIKAGSSSLTGIIHVADDHSARSVTVNIQRVQIASHISSSVTITIQIGEGVRLARKKMTGSLINRVMLLEDILRQNGIDVPPEDYHATCSQHSVQEFPDTQDGEDWSKSGPTDNPQASPEDDSRVPVLDESNLARFASATEPLLWFHQMSIPREHITQSHDVIDSASSFWKSPRYSSYADAEHSETTHDTPETRKCDAITGDQSPELCNERTSSHFSSTQYLEVPTRCPEINKGSASASIFLVQAHGGLQGHLKVMDRHNSHQDGVQSCLLQDGRTETEGQDEFDEQSMIEQLSARMGAFQIAEDGQLRYFGATSNLHILHNGLSSLARAPGRSTRSDGEDALIRAGLGQKISTEAERHLEDLYFDWENPAIYVVDKEMYFEEQIKYRSGKETSFYSETLKNAICGIGANLNTRIDLDLPQGAGEFYNSRAKVLLDIEMDCPSIATVQALVIMSALEAAATRDARGWLYSGMAVRLSADLGLNIDPGDNLLDTALSAREIDVRRTTFWGVFIQNNMWSIYVGRPWGINIEDISTLRHSRKDITSLCADANVSLCVMMRQLGHTIYSEKALSQESLGTFATGMRLQLENWRNALPPELDVKVPTDGALYPPHVLQLQ